MSVKIRRDSPAHCSEAFMSNLQNASICADGNSCGMCSPEDRNLAAKLVFEARHTLQFSRILQTTLVCNKAHAGGDEGSKTNSYHLTSSVIIAPLQISICRVPTSQWPSATALSAALPPVPGMLRPS